MKMTFRTTVIGGALVFFAVTMAVVFIPSFVWDPPQTRVAHPYSPEEARGREVFLSNGCNYCHTQYVREEDTAMGPVSKGGDYVFDNPMILGSERTGPDLSYVGRKRSKAWEIAHWKNPRQLSPLSIMPNFSFLPDKDLEAMSAYLFALGDRVAGARMIRPPESYAGAVDPLSYPAIAAVPNDPSPGWTAWTASKLQEGKELYVENCLTCHGAAGNGLGSYGGTLSVTPADFKQAPFRNMPDDQWFWHVSEGIPGTVMPTWRASLSEDQRWKVIRYIQQIFSRPMMRDPNEGDPVGIYAGLANPLPLTVETIEAGKSTFTRECLVCHGAAGTGNGPYREGLQPSPPDFSDGSYGTLKDPSYTDADYFWRISEGLPWSAMPAWKSQYPETKRWELVHYIRANFTQTEIRPPRTESTADFPDLYSKATVPNTASFERGKLTYLQNCASCHGLGGRGDGWEGAYLDIKPSDFTSTGMKGKTEGRLFAELSLAVPNSAHPAYGEFLPEDQRWDAIKFIREAFVSGPPPLPSPRWAGTVDSNIITLSQKNWLGEGHVISASHGSDLYSNYCVTCHGKLGKSASPPKGISLAYSLDAFLPRMDLASAFARVWNGVPETTMPPFQWMLEESDIWDIVSYMASFYGQGGKK